MFFIYGMKGVVSILFLYFSVLLTRKGFKDKDGVRFGCLGLILIVISIICLFKLGEDNPKINNSEPQDSKSVQTAIDEMNAAIAVPDSAAVVAPEYNESSGTPNNELQEISKFQGNQLSNGASPFNECFGNGIYGGNAYIIFDNGNSTDVVVCLTNYNSGKTIRNEYIRAGQRYKVTSIPTGTYTIKGYYGNDWNPNKQNFCGTKGGFDNSEHFSKSDGIGDLINIENSSRSYTTGTITLYSVANGNMGTQSINENEFFK